MKNLRTFYLAVFIAAVITSFALSLNVQPQVGAINLFGWNFGFNFRDNLMIKLIGFTALLFYIINPKFKK